MGSRHKGAGMKAIALGALAASASALGASGCGDSDPKPAPATTAAAEVRDDRFTYARTLFDEMCAGCHTLADAGATGRRFDLDTESAITLLLRTREQKLRLARHVIEDGALFMPGFGGTISRREVDALVEYVVAVAGRGS